MSKTKRTQKNYWADTKNVQKFYALHRFDAFWTSLAVFSQAKNVCVYSQLKCWCHSSRKHTTYLIQFSVWLFLRLLTKCNDKVVHRMMQLEMHKTSEPIWKLDYAEPHWCERVERKSQKAHIMHVVAVLIRTSVSFFHSFMCLPR